NAILAAARKRDKLAYTLSCRHADTFAIGQTLFLLYTGHTLPKFGVGPRLSNDDLLLAKRQLATNNVSEAALNTILAMLQKLTPKTPSRPTPEELLPMLFA
ncbi:MAG: hypothetical protein KDK65_06625, partial [Chlamydiia bacterium]|nr:hypothetical protein [Chlamydiia bacterium]